MLLSEDVREISEIVRQGGVIAYPTEAVFGLGCDPDNQHAVRRILKLKSRAAEKGLILIAAQLSQLEKYILPLNPAQQALLQQPRQHPTTWLVPSRAETPNLLRGQFDTLAVRITEHPGCRRLCTALGHALVSTSANPQGQPPALDPPAVEAYFADQVDAIMDGALGGYARPSRLIDLNSQQLIRD